MATMKYSTLAKSGRVFHNIQEVDETLMRANRIATENTLKVMKEKLHEFIEQDVYNNVHTTSNATARQVFGNNYQYQSKWGGRTGSLLDDSAIEYYIYNAFGKGIGSVLRFNDDSYRDNTDTKNFIHGNDYFGELNFNSYLEMLNNSRTMLVENPYHFPTGAELYRRPFWNDFREWVNHNYKTIFGEKLRLALGAKPNLMGFTNKGKSSSMNLSSSTKNIQSIGTYNV